MKHALMLRNLYCNFEQMPKINLLYGGGSYANLLYSLFPNSFVDVDNLVLIDKTLTESYFSLSCRYFQSFGDAKEKILELINPSLLFQLAIGNHYGYERVCIYRKMIAEGFEIVKLQHNSSHILSDAVHHSVVILPNVTIMPFVKINECCIINTSATLDHEVSLGAGCHVMGGSYIAGRVKIGKYTTIGSNSTIFPDVKIGSNCFVGAGSVVNKDVPDNHVVVGNPARFLKFSRTLS